MNDNNGVNRDALLIVILVQWLSGEGECSGNDSENDRNRGQDCC